MSPPRRGPVPRRPSLPVYVAGALAARTGDETAGPALALAGFALAGAPADVAALLACVTGAAALGGPLLGVLLDGARRPGRLLAGALLLYAAGLGAVLFGLGRLPFAVTSGAAVVTGLMGPALSGGWTAQLPRLVRDRPDGGAGRRANVLDALTFDLAALAGPALAGGAALLAGAPAAVVVAAALVAAAAPAAWTLPGAPARPVDGRPAGLAREVAAGVGAVLRRGPLRWATLTSVGCCVAQGLVAACLPLLGQRALGGSGRGTLLLSAAAAAALAATALAGRARRAPAPETVLRAGAAVQAAAWALAASAHPAAVVAAFLLAGAAEGPQLAALFAVRHREAPEGVRGRVFTTGASLKISGYAVGAALTAPVAGRSLAGCLLLAAGVAALSALPGTRPRRPAPGTRPRRPAPGRAGRRARAAQAPGTPRSGCRPPRA